MRSIFIDESYDSGKTDGERYFVLTALKTSGVETLETAIKDTRKQIKQHNNNHKGKKRILLQEIHEHEIHTRYPMVKKWVLENTFRGRKVEIYTQIHLITEKFALISKANYNSENDKRGNVYNSLRLGLTTTP